VNDERPRFELPVYIFDVEENQSSGVEVGVVAAADRELPPFNEFTLSWRSSSAVDQFVIDSHTGLITTARPLDHELQVEHVSDACTISQHHAEIDSVRMRIVDARRKDTHARVIMRPPHSVQALCNDDRCLSVRPSVCPMADPKSRTEGHKKLKTGRKEAYDTGDP